mmetsp:Transcript_61936/g.147759  ORF Transcript_61936/g.147759 Transcript_61936/m.147759 type:complete len:392 (-) Transcript_61936:272-1447(-)
MLAAACALAAPKSQEPTTTMCTEAISLRKNYPLQVPVIVTRKCSAMAQPDGKPTKPAKLLVEKKRIGYKFVSVCRKRCSGACPDDEVYIGGGFTVPLDLLMSEIDEKHRSEDGFLYADLYPKEEVKEAKTKEAAVTDAVEEAKRDPARLKEVDLQRKDAAARLQAATTRCRRLEPHVKLSEDRLREKSRDADIALELLQLEKDKFEARASHASEVEVDVKQVQRESRTTLARAQAAELALKVKDDQVKAGEKTIHALKQELQAVQAEVEAQRAVSAEKSLQNEELGKEAEHEAAKAVLAALKLHAMEAAACQAAARATEAEQALREMQQAMGELRIQAEQAEHSVAEMRAELELQEAGFTLVAEAEEDSSEDEDGFIVVSACAGVRESRHF